MNNQVNWFEVATNNLERAKDFYAAVLKRALQLVVMPDSKMYMLQGSRMGKVLLGH